LISKEYGWADGEIKILPYYRFCQIIETINRRLVDDYKRELEVKEIITRFETSIFTIGSYLTKEGKNEILSRINDFSILRKDKEEVKKEDKKLPPIGSYEKLMGLFGGRK